VHLTSDSAEAAIAAQKTLGTGASTIYAGPAALADASGLGATVRTGLLPSQTTAAILIPEAANGAFRAPLVIGPITTWQRVTGAVFTEGAGSINLTTGVFTRTGAATNQIVLYGLDTAMNFGPRVFLAGVDAYTEPTSSIGGNATSSRSDAGASQFFDLGGTSSQTSTTASDVLASVLLRPDEIAAQKCFVSGAR
jgi:hypothetical protein